MVARHEDCINCLSLYCLHHRLWLFLCSCHLSPDEICISSHFSIFLPNHTRSSAYNHSLHTKRDIIQGHELKCRDLLTFSYSPSEYCHSLIVLKMTSRRHHHLPFPAVAEDTLKQAATHLHSLLGSFLEIS